MPEQLIDNEPQFPPEAALFLLRRLEFMESVVALLVQRGILAPKDLASLALRSTLNHAERRMRVNHRVGREDQELEQAIETIRSEYDRLEQSSVGDAL